MEKFEGLFEDLDVHTQVLDSTMSAATTLNTPEDQVESLMKQVAEQNGLEVLDKLAEHPVSQQTPASGVPTLSTGEEDKLSQRYKLNTITCLKWSIQRPELFGHAVEHLIVDSLK